MTSERLTPEQLAEGYVEVLRFRDAADMQEGIRDGIIADGKPWWLDFGPGQKVIDEGRRDIAEFLRVIEAGYEMLEPDEQAWVRSEVERRWKKVKRPSWFTGG